MNLSKLVGEGEEGERKENGKSIRWRREKTKNESEGNFVRLYENIVSKR